MSVQMFAKELRVMRSRKDDALFTAPKLQVSISWHNQRKRASAITLSPKSARHLQFFIQVIHESNYLSTAGQLLFGAPITLKFLMDNT